MNIVEHVATQQTSSTAHPFPRLEIPGSVLPVTCATEIETRVVGIRAAFHAHYYARKLAVGALGYTPIDGAAAGSVGSEPESAADLIALRAAANR